MIAISLVLFGVLFGACVNVAGSSVDRFIDFPSVVLVIAGILVFVIGSGQVSTFFHGMKQLFRFREVPGQQRKAAMKTAQFFKTLSYFSVVIGALWTLVGLVLMLSNLNPETIGGGIAVSLLTLFYSFVLSVAVFMPISMQYRKMATKHHRHPKKRVFSFHEKFPASYT